jgi:hypothetical protein
VTRRRVLFALPVMLVAASACGGSDKTTADASQVNSPIAEYLGYDPESLGDPAANEAKFIEQERARQDAVAACMKKQGFEYTAQDPSSYVNFGSTASDGLEYGSAEWVAKYGFGISTQRWSQAAVGPDLVGYDDSQFQPTEAVADPNMGYVEGLSPEEQAAYNKALYGDTPAYDQTMSDEETASTMSDGYAVGGCYAEAQSASNSLETQFYQEFSDELNAMYERAQNDPRVVEATKTVSDCVASKGLEYTDQEKLFTDIDAQLSAIQALLPDPGAGLSEEELSKASPEELDRIFNQPVEFSDEAKSKLAEVQASEIELAKAVDACGGGYEAQGKVFQEVIAEYEQQFVDDNASRLAELKAASNS